MRPDASVREPARMHDGLVIVDKPAGWTSHDVVAKLRGVYKQKRIGHTGTLDPDATGVLVVALGRATRLVRYLQLASKIYRGEVAFGVATDTLDAAGQVLERCEMNIDEATVRTAMPAFLGEIQQLPPMVSAVKIDGRKLYEAARAGETVERSPRTVRIDRFELEAFTPGPFPHATVLVECGSGVRVLAADLGHALGGGAHLSALRRTSVGPWAVDEATDLEHLRVLDPATVTRVLPGVSVDDATAAEVRHGRPLPPDRLGVDGPGPWAVTDASGVLLAVYERQRADRVKPALVLDPAG